VRLVISDVHRPVVEMKILEENSRLLYSCSMRDREFLVGKGISQWRRKREKTIQGCLFLYGHGRKVP
jgi:hypothetical protein